MTVFTPRRLYTFSFGSYPIAAADFSYRWWAATWARSGEAASIFINPRRLDSCAKSMCFLPIIRCLLGENYSSKMFGHVVGVPVDDTSRLPAQEVAHGILAEPVDAVQVGPPFRGDLHRFFTDRLQRHACRCVPDVVPFVDAPLSLPPGVPVGVIGLSIQVDGQIDPVACRRDLEFAIVLDVGPIVSQKELDHVAVPQF